MTTGAFARTRRTTLKRLPQRGTFDKAEICSILDEALICHVGFVVDGQPFVIPTSFAREGDTLLIHGSAASRMLRAVAGGIPICVTVTLLDGLVLARSVFHHSMNYRSVVVLGSARIVSEPEAKRAALRAFTEHVLKGRWDEARQPSPAELKATTVLALPLHEVSAKIRKGPPGDDDVDYALPVWAGVVPLALSSTPPIPDPRLTPGLEPSARIRAYRRAE